MKTPEEMADEWVLGRWYAKHDPIVSGESKVGFLAGYHTAYNIAYELGFESALKTQKIIKFFDQRREKGNENS